MSKTFSILGLLISLLHFSTLAQNITVEGYAFEQGNRGFLNEVKITVLDRNSKAVRGETYSNIEGFFTVDLPAETDFLLRANKKVFEPTEVEFTTKGTPPDKKVYLKVEIDRKPGYLFDVTMAEKRQKNEVVDAIQGAKIEVYNNTLKKEELVLDNYEYPNFNATFEQGNHYTIMIRKQGFFTKRMEAYVNVKGCILCFDGVGDVRPGVSDVMTKNNTMGTLLANVELDRVKLNKSIKIENIYYDLAKSKIRKDAAEELDKLLVTLKDNPSIIVELGSHTDCRGKDAYNLKLSQARAEAAVDYLVERGIDSKRIQAKGYGETVLVNECEDGVRCSERRHQLNRRTELKIIGFLASDPYANMSLKEILEEEKFQQMMLELDNQEIIQVQEGEELPDEIKNSQSKKPATKTNQQQPQKPTSSLPKTENSEQLINGSKQMNLPSTTTSTSAPTQKTKVPNSKTMGKTTPTNTPARPEQPMPTVTPGEVSTGKVVSGSDIEILIQTQEISSNNGSVRNSKIVEEEKVVSNNSAYQLKNLASDYTGYSVEIVNSMSRLPESHKIFSQHGNLTLEETKDGTYAYLLGEFDSKRDAKAFLENILAPRYPKAKIVTYFKGRRTN